MTAIGLGCVNLGSSVNRTVHDDIALVHAALDLGVTVFDTADVYGSGASEHVLGRALRGRRDNVVIATKGGFVHRERSPIEQWMRRRAKRWAPSSDRVGSANPASASASYDRQNFTPAAIRQAIRGSLRRLGTDRIDVYQLHGPEGVIADLLSDLTDLVSTGEVGRFGVGAGTVATADAWVTVEGVRVLQIPLGLLDPQAANTTVPLARSVNVELSGRAGALGGGLISLAQRDPAALTSNPKRAQLEVVQAIAKTSGRDVYDLALGFVRAIAPEVSTVLVGTTSVEHLRRNVSAAAAGPLPADVFEALAGSVGHTSAA